MSVRKLILCWALAATPLAFADPLTVFLSAGAYTCLGRSGCTLQDFQSVSTGTAGVSGTYQSPLLGSTAQLIGSASATPRYGILGASASSIVTITGASAVAGSGGFPAFEDILTVNDPSRTGQQGFLTVGYTLNGTITQTGNDFADAKVLIYAGASLEQRYSAMYTHSVFGTFNGPTAQFTYGSPFGLYMELFAETGFIGIGNGTGNADFSNTLTLSGLGLTDAAGNAVGGATFSSATGTRYTQNGVLAQTPEPTSIVLITTGVTMLGVARLKRT